MPACVSFPSMAALICSLAQMMVYSLDLSAPVHSYCWVVCVLNLDPVSLISCLLSGALMIQVSGGTVQLYAFTETLCGQLFFSSITEDALVPQHRCLLEKREADSLSLQQCPLCWDAACCLGCGGFCVFMYSSTGHLLTCMEH